MPAEAREPDQSNQGDLLAANRRDRGRVLQDQLKSSLGPVLDISAGGMRIVCRKPPTSVLEVTIGEGDDAIRLIAKPAWIKRIGLFKYEVGMKFLEVPKDLGERLCGISMTNRARRVI